MENQDYDKVYKEHFEVQDQQEIEKMVEEAIQNAQNEKTAEGEDELTESEKETVAKKTRFEIMTKGFWAPEAAEEHRKLVAAEEQARVQSSEADQRAQSAMSSQKESQIDKKSQENESPPYTPLVPEMWKEKCQQVGNLHLFKYRKILQSLFYLLRVEDRESICQRFTNRLNWKKVKPYLQKGDSESIYAKLAEYWPFGPKEDEFREYQKLKFIKDNIEGITEEEVDEFAVSLGKLFKWLAMAIDLRIDDVKTRRKFKQKERENREDVKLREEERMERRQNELNEAKEAFEKQLEDEKGDKEDSDHPEDLDQKFNEQEFIDKFDEENPPFEIPPEVEEDVDNDYNFEEEEEQQE